MAATAIGEPRAAPARRHAGANASFARWFAVLVVVALVFRVVVVLTTPHFVPRTDAADYDRIAVSLAQHGRLPASQLDPHGGPTALRPPLFPGALALVYKVVGVGSASSRWEAGRLFEAGLGAIAVALICLIALRLWGHGAALLSGAIAAIYPPLVMVGSSLMTESLFIPLMLAAVLAALVGRDRGHPVRWAALAGVLLGLAALSRGNGIALVVPLAFLVWVNRPRLSRRSIGAPLALLASCALTLVPWTVRNELVLHQLVPISTEPGYVVAGTYNTYSAHWREFPALWVPPVAEIRQTIAQHPRLNEAQLSNRVQALGFDYAKAHPSYVLRVFWWNTLRLLNLTGLHYERWVSAFDSYPGWLTVASFYAFWALALFALAGAFTARARQAPRALWWCPVVILLSNVFFQESTRYRSPADLFFIMLAALALRSAIGGLRRRRVAAGIRLPSAPA